MKKRILILSILIFVPAVLACDMDNHGNEITGAAISGNSVMISFNYILIILLAIIFGLAYVIYKLHKIEEKINGIGRKK